MGGGQTLTISELLKRIVLCKSDFTVSESSQENAVRFMTMHASKGLEFPVVIICGTERKFSSLEERSSILFDRDYGFAVEYFNDSTKTYSSSPLQFLLINKMRFSRIREEMRLFYVATTRATNSLHVTIQDKEDTRVNAFLGAERYCDFIPLSVPITNHTEEDVNFYNIKNQSRKVLLGKCDLSLKQKMLENLSFNYPYLEQTTLPLKTNVTATLQKLNSDFAPEYVLFEDDSTDAQKGTIAHKILQYFDFNSNESVESQSLSMVEKGIITREERDKINYQRLNVALSNDIFKEIKNKKLYREQSFIIEQKANELFNVKTDEKVLLQGIIDLLVLDGEDSYVIDYKYSSLNKDSLLKKYKLQLDLYANAVEQVLIKKVKQKVIVNIFTGDVVLL